MYIKPYHSSHRTVPLRRKRSLQDLQHRIATASLLLLCTPMSDHIFATALLLLCVICTTALSQLHYSPATLCHSVPVHSVPVHLCLTSFQQLIYTLHNTPLTPAPGSPVTSAQNLSNTFTTPLATFAHVFATSVLCICHICTQSYVATALLQSPGVDSPTVPHQHHPFFLHQPRSTTSSPTSSSSPSIPSHPSPPPPPTHPNITPQWPSRESCGPLLTAK